MQPLHTVHHPLLHGAPPPPPPPPQWRTGVVPVAAVPPAAYIPLLPIAVQTDSPPRMTRPDVPPAPLAPLAALPAVRAQPEVRLLVAPPVFVFGSPTRCSSGVARPPWPPS
jgi:hypothetical protein